MNNQPVNHTIGKKWGVALLTFAFTCQAMAADFTARVNATQVGVNDSFQLTLSTDEAQSSSPDLSVLAKDFTMLGTSQSRQVQIINGKTSQSQSWIITLSPNKTGQLTIPAITLGALQSQALSLTVAKDSPVAANQNDGDIRITAELEAGKYYQFQEIPLTVRIETTADIPQAELIAPQSADIELTQSGQDQQSQQIRNGQAISVIERRYLLRPQSVGELSLSPFVLRGYLRSKSGRDAFDPFADFERRFGSPFGGMGRSGEPFVAKSKALTLNVSANPNTNGSPSDWFLPAKAVELQAEWSPQNPSFKVGEPVTRTIRLLALGARAEQLPKLDFPAVDGLKFYIDNDQTVMRDTAQGTQALREITLSVVPTHGGEVTVPKIAVKWLNTQSNQAETATLPAQTINVVGTAPITANPQNTSNTSNAPTTVIADGLTDGKSDTTEPTSNSKSWLWWSIAISLGMLLLAVMMLLVMRKKRNSQSESPTPTDNRQHAFNAVKTAVQSGDKSQLYRALLAWKNSGVVFSDKLNDALKHLEQALFGGKIAQTIELNTIGEEAQRLQKQQKHNIEKHNSDRKLPPLYH